MEKSNKIAKEVASKEPVAKLVASKEQITKLVGDAKPTTKLIRVSEIADKIHYNSFRLRQLLRSPQVGKVYDDEFINYEALEKFLIKNVGEDKFKETFGFEIKDLESHLDYSRGHKKYNNSITLEAVKKFHLGKKIILKIHVNKYDVMYLGETNMAGTNYLMFKNVDSESIRTYEESYLKNDFIKFYKSEEDLESK